MGRANVTPYSYHAYLFDPCEENTDLGTLVGNYSEAWSINDIGQFVGYAWASSGGSPYACLFNPAGQNIDLGALSGGSNWATCINDNGHIVGWSSTSSSQWHACLFEVGRQPTDLNMLIDPDSSWVLRRAMRINNDGWIVGMGLNPQGQSHAFILIPEPATVALLGLGGMVLCRKRPA